MDQIERRIVQRSDLETSVDNWFKWIPATKGMDAITDQLLDADGIKPFGTVINLDERMIRGTEMGKIVHLARPRDINIREKWEITEETERFVRARNKNTRDEIKAPISALYRSLRTHSGVRAIQIDGNHDYLVVKRFQGDEVLWEEWPKFDPANRGDEFRQRICSFALIRRINIAVPGVSLMAFCGNETFIPSKMLWCIKGLDKTSRQLLSMWFNSTLGIIAMFAERAETEGSFSGWDKEIWAKVLALDPGQLGDLEKAGLANAFDEVRIMQFPSLIDQFKMKFKGRMIIDRAIFKAIGMDEHARDDALSDLYDTVYEEIYRLSGITMGGDSE